MVFLHEKLIDAQVSLILSLSYKSILNFLSDVQVSLILTPSRQFILNCFVVQFNVSKCIQELFAHHSVADKNLRRPARNNFYTKCFHAPFSNSSQASLQISSLVCQAIFSQIGKFTYPLLLLPSLSSCSRAISQLVRFSTFSFIVNLPHSFSG